MNEHSDFLKKGGFTPAFTPPPEPPAPAWTPEGFARTAVRALIGSLLFNWNKVAHMGVAFSARRNSELVNKADSLDYCVSPDEKGILRGGSLPWSYVRDLCEDSLDERQKSKDVQRTLATLPSHVTFAFNTAPAPALKDENIISTAFKKAGFTHTTRKTFLYRGEAGIDPISLIKSDTRNKIRAAQRDMEIVPMGIDEFFSFYEANLEAIGKTNNFFVKIDQALFEAGASGRDPKVDILAARRKTAEGNSPIEAAIACSCGDDGFYKFTRISYKRGQSSDMEQPPHKHAIKFLVYEAMKRSADRGLVLDVDGTTEGGETLYSRFGVFEETYRNEYSRKTSATLLKGKIIPLLQKIL
ncbi:MAG: hypothetical protein DI551_08460 [Micavibrio aeruginosavorus]|uniref:BioF2-like acetyltransferase domain-containing protein n=1 Tax=Micavibrio aeruginosavorus TaxID=349221 RepID=A0A2W5MXN5_9BACT|nr:MAG: hypothetical protein DI551_08460 [Micavibrio aeruginosavorus]